MSTAEMERLEREVLGYALSVARAREDGAALMEQTGLDLMTEAARALWRARKQLDEVRATRRVDGRDVTLVSKEAER